MLNRRFQLHSGEVVFEFSLSFANRISADDRQLWRESLSERLLEDQLKNFRN